MIKRPWFKEASIFSPAVDLWAFVFPVALSWGVVAILGSILGWDATVPAAMFFLGIALVDGSHVWTTFYRTHLDSEEWGRRKKLYTKVMLGCLGVSVALSVLPTRIWFLRFLTYFAMYHFLRQQFGWVAMASRKAGDSPQRFRLDKVAIYIVSGFPLLWIHTLPTAYWFSPGDLIRVPSAIGSIGHYFFFAALSVSVGLEIADWWKGRGLNLPKLYVFGGTALTWYLAWFWLMTPVSFYFNLVLIHGIPYYFLMYRYGRERWKNASAKTTIPWSARVFRASSFLPFYLAPVMVAAGWHFLKASGVYYWLVENLGQRFGYGLYYYAILPVWALAQLSHYALDGFIWRFGKDNPGLREYLGFQKPASQQG